MTDNQDTWPAGATATMSVTYTQANAAGGAVVCEITPGSGNEFQVLNARMANSGTNSANMGIETAAGGTLITAFVGVGSAAGTHGSFPQSVGLATSTSDIANSAGEKVIVSGSQAFKIYQSGAGAQNDTMLVLVNIRCKGAVPTVTHANSTNPANVSVTAGAESFTTV